MVTTSSRAALAAAALSLAGPPNPWLPSAESVRSQITDVGRATRELREHPLSIELAARDVFRRIEHATAIYRGVIENLMRAPVAELPPLRKWIAVTDDNLIYSTQMEISTRVVLAAMGRHNLAERLGAASGELMAVMREAQDLLHSTELRRRAMHTPSPFQVRSREEIASTPFGRRLLELSAAASRERTTGWDREAFYREYPNAPADLDEIEAQLYVSRRRYLQDGQ